MDNKGKNPLLEMPIWKALFILALPIIISNMLQVAYQFIDSFWVWRLGAWAVATTTLSSTIIFSTISVGSWFAVAGSILIAQFYWAKNYEKVNHTAAQTLLMIIFTSVVLWIIWYFISPALIHIMWVQSTNEIFPQTLQFVRLAFLALIFNFSFFMFQSIMRWVGRPNLPIFIVLFTVILNFLFNPLLIYWYWSFQGYGVIWSALATILAQSIATLIWFIILFSWKFWIHTKLSDYKPDFQVIKRSFFLWLPSSIEMTARSFSFAFITWIVGVFWTLALAWYGVAWNIVQFVVILAMWLSMATSVLVGQSVGAWMIDRAKQINRMSSIISFILLTFVWSLTFIFAPNLMRFFIPEDPRVVELWTQMIRIASFFFW
jgi:putative MATE family efflux protein